MKHTTKAQGGKVSRPKLSTPTNSRRIFQLLHDETQTEAGQRELVEWFDQLMNDAAPRYEDAPLFDLAFPAAVRAVEQGKHDGQPIGAATAYRALQDILTRTAKGETLAAIAQARRAALRAGDEQHKQAQRDAPEPKDKLSDEWRYWQIARVTHDLSSGAPGAYERAWGVMRHLFDGLAAEPNFWRVDFILPLLPHLIIARQDIDEMLRYERRMRAGMKGAETRKRKQAERAQ
jgi:hypothetical protein